MCRDTDKSLTRPGRKQANVSIRMAWISFGSLPCRKKKNLMTACVSMLLKSRVSLTCFLACFLPGRAKDLSAPRYVRSVQYDSFLHFCNVMLSSYVVKQFLTCLYGSSCPYSDWRHFCCTFRMCRRIYSRSFSYYRHY